MSTKKKSSYTAAGPILPAITAQPVSNGAQTSREPKTQAAQQVQPPTNGSQTARVQSNKKSQPVAATLDEKKVEPILNALSPVKKTPIKPQPPTSVAAATVQPTTTAPSSQKRPQNQSVTSKPSQPTPNAAAVAGPILPALTKHVTASGAQTSREPAKQVQQSQPQPSNAGSQTARPGKNSNKKPVVVADVEEKQVEPTPPPAQNVITSPRSKKIVANTATAAPTAPSQPQPQPSKTQPQPAPTKSNSSTQKSTEQPAPVVEPQPVVPSKPSPVTKPVQSTPQPQPVTTTTKAKQAQQQPPPQQSTPVKPPITAAAGTKPVPVSSPQPGVATKSPQPTPRPAPQPKQVLKVVARHAVYEDENVEVEEEEEVIQPAAAAKPVASTTQSTQPIQSGSQKKSQSQSQTVESPPQPTAAAKSSSSINSKKLTSSTTSPTKSTSNKQITQPSDSTPTSPAVSARQQSKRVEKSAVAPQATKSLAPIPAAATSAQSKPSAASPQTSNKKSTHQPPPPTQVVESPPQTQRVVAKKTSAASSSNKKPTAPPPANHEEEVEEEIEEVQPAKSHATKTAVTSPTTTTRSPRPVVANVAATVAPAANAKQPAASTLTSPKSKPIQTTSAVATTASPVVPPKVSSQAQSTTSPITTPRKQQPVSTAAAQQPAPMAASSSTKKSTAPIPTPTESPSTSVTPRGPPNKSPVRPVAHQTSNAPTSTVTTNPAPATTSKSTPTQSTAQTTPTATPQVQPKSIAPVNTTTKQPHAPTTTASPVTSTKKSTLTPNGATPASQNTKNLVTPAVATATVTSPPVSGRKTNAPPPNPVVNSSPPTTQKKVVQPTAPVVETASPPVSTRRVSQPTAPTPASPATSSKKPSTTSATAAVVSPTVSPPVSSRKVAVASEATVASTPITTNSPPASNKKIAPVTPSPTIESPPASSRKTNAAPTVTTVTNSNKKSVSLNATVASSAETPPAVHAKKQPVAVTASVPATSTKKSNPVTVAPETVAEVASPKQEKIVPAAPISPTRPIIPYAQARAAAHKKKSPTHAAVNASEQEDEATSPQQVNSTPHSNKPTPVTSPRSSTKAWDSSRRASVERQEEDESPAAINSARSAQPEDDLLELSSPLPPRKPAVPKQRKIGKPTTQLSLNSDGEDTEPVDNDPPPTVLTEAETLAVAVAASKVSSPSFTSKTREVASLTVSGSPVRTERVKKPKPAVSEPKEIDYYKSAFLVLPKEEQEAQAKAEQLRLKLLVDARKSARHKPMPVKKKKVVKPVDEVPPVDVKTEKETEMKVTSPPISPRHESSTNPNSTTVASPPISAKKKKEAKPVAAVQADVKTEKEGKHTSPPVSSRAKPTKPVTTSPSISFKKKKSAVKPISAILADVKKENEIKASSASPPISPRSQSTTTTTVATETNSTVASSSAATTDSMIPAPSTAITSEDVPSDSIAPTLMTATVSETPSVVVTDSTIPASAVIVAAVAPVSSPGSSSPSRRSSQRRSLVRVERVRDEEEEEEETKPAPPAEQPQIASTSTSEEPQPPAESKQTDSTSASKEPHTPATVIVAKGESSSENAIVPEPEAKSVEPDPYMTDEFLPNVDEATHGVAPSIEEAKPAEAAPQTPPKPALASMLSIDTAAIPFTPTPLVTPKEHGSLKKIRSPNFSSLELDAETLRIQKEERDAQILRIKRTRSMDFSKVEGGMYALAIQQKQELEAKKKEDAESLVFLQKQKDEIDEARQKLSHAKRYIGIEIVDAVPAVSPSVTSDSTSSSEPTPAAPDGVRIIEVKPNTSASQAGLLVGDIIMSINGIETHSKSQFGTALKSTEIGQTVPVVIRTAGKQKKKVGGSTKKKDVDEQPASIIEMKTKTIDLVIQSSDLSANEIAHLQTVLTNETTVQLALSQLKSQHHENQVERVQHSVIQLAEVETEIFVKEVEHKIEVKHLESEVIESGDLKKWKSLKIHLGLEVIDVTERKVNATVRTATSTADPKLGAMKVTKIFPGDAADKAGMQLGDLIINVHGHPCCNRQEFEQIITGHAHGDSKPFQPGDQVDFIILRATSFEGDAAAPMSPTKKSGATPRTLVPTVLHQLVLTLEVGAKDMSYEEMHDLRTKVHALRDAKKKLREQEQLAQADAAAKKEERANRRTSGMANTPILVEESNAATGDPSVITNENGLIALATVTPTSASASASTTSSSHTSPATSPRSLTLTGSGVSPLSTLRSKKKVIHSSRPSIVHELKETESETTGGEVKPIMPATIVDEEYSEE